MLNITLEYEDSGYNCPSNAVIAKKGMKTKELYIMYQYIKPQNANLSQSTYSGSIYKYATNNTDEISFDIYKSGNYVSGIYLKIKNSGKIENHRVYDEDGDPVYYYIIKSDTPLEILFDVEDSIYCIPELPPPEIIPVDKTPTTTSLNDITNYINKTTESIKSCKSYIAYVINNKGGSATDTETLESLINKLKDIKF